MNTDVQSRRFGVSTVSLAPWSLGRWGLLRAIGMASKAGFNGLQALPMRGWNFALLKDFGEYIISYEDAWNHGPLYKALLRAIGRLEHPAPTIKDLVLFGQPTMPTIPQSMKVQHRFSDDPDVVEVNPDLAIRRSIYADFCNCGGKLCLDTTHLRRKSANGRKIEDGMWQGFLHDLPEYAVALIHVQPISAEEDNRFLGGYRTELGNMLQLIGKKYPNVPAILEVRPVMATHAATIARLAKYRRVMEYWLDNR